MSCTRFSLPEEPRDLKARTRAVFEQSPQDGLSLLEQGDWIVDPLWAVWGDELRRLDLDRAELRRIVVGYRNELRLWVVGERPWEHAAGGLAGRISRRLDGVCRDGVPAGLSRATPAGESGVARCAPI